MKKIFAEAILIIVLSVLVGCMINVSRPDGIPFVGDWSEPGQDGMAFGSYIDVQTAYSLWKEKKAVFVDARIEKDFPGDHIPGALNLPHNAPEKHWDAFCAAVSRDQTIVVYCGSEDCSNSIDVARYLKWRNYRRLYIFKGGVFAWDEKGYPLE